MIHLDKYSKKFKLPTGKGDTQMKKCKLCLI